MSKTDIRNLLAVLCIVGSFALVFTLVVVKITETNKDLVYMATSTMLAANAIVLSYFFGSSKREADQDKNDRHA